MNQLLCLSFGLLNWSGLSINAIRLLFCSHPSALPSLLRVKPQVLTWTTRNCMIWHNVISDPLPSPLLPHSAAATSAPLLFLQHTHVPALGSLNLQFPLPRTLFPGISPLPNPSLYEMSYQRGLPLPHFLK